MKCLQVKDFKVTEEGDLGDEILCGTEASYAWKTSAGDGVCEACKTLMDLEDVLSPGELIPIVHT